jgi:hypothetical protein
MLQCFVSYSTASRLIDTFEVLTSSVSPKEIVRGPLTSLNGATKGFRLIERPVTASLNHLTLLCAVERWGYSTE